MCQLLPNKKKRFTFTMTSKLGLYLSARELHALLRIDVYFIGHRTTKSIKQKE